MLTGKYYTLQRKCSLVFFSKTIVLCGLLLIECYASQAFAQNFASCEVSGGIKSRIFNPIAGLDDARNRLNLGIADFDSGRFAVATRNIKAALKTGLNDQSEKALAHKYLGIYYCNHNSAKLCETHLGRALSLAPDLDLFDIDRPSARLLRMAKKLSGRNAPCASNQENVVGANASADRTQPQSAPEAVPIPFVSKEPMLVELDVRPWGEVYINKKRVGLTPPTKELRLPPGKHQVEIRNGSLGVFRTKVDSSQGLATRISHQF